LGFKVITIMMINQIEKNKKEEPMQKELVIIVEILIQLVIQEDHVKDVHN